ncbi:MAG: hypothetical protein C4538_12680 [Nitrospiraceae bacterium]|nr:MAG: hypothetical protein C4538_12680 [Nitrospiraceae bacterium]
MPITFIDIERQKSWRIVLLFGLLIIIYFIIIFAIYASFYQIFSLGFFSLQSILKSTSQISIIFFFSSFIASMHYYLAASNAVAFIRKSTGATEPDKDDGVHRQLINIIDEIYLASGRKTKIHGLVIPTLSMNALSAVDMRGNSVIAVTEGLLSRVTRPQLETVVAHEAYHILSGDCLETTVAASLFGIPSSVIEKISSASEGRVWLSPAFLVAMVLVKISYLLNMFISREREYRADAGAVRMTRNPLALAEVLYLLSRHWKGAGHIGAGLEMLCIMNTSESSLDESEEWFADLMSTHPPVQRRIRLLLQMAHASISELKKQTKEAAAGEIDPAPEKTFYALDNRYQWQGPFSMTELAVLPWLTADTWTSNNGNAVLQALQIPSLDIVLRQRFADDARTQSDCLCPSCRYPLVPVLYEKAKIYQCRFCGGSLVNDARLPRIIVRKDIKYSERIRALSRITLSENQEKMLARNKNKAEKINNDLLCCPKCKSRMTRTFYSMAYLIELDRCSSCGVSWFDNDELEMLQCMIDNKMASESSPVYTEPPPLDKDSVPGIPEG